MKVEVKYKEIKNPIERVILELTEKEAFILKVLTGAITGSGEFRVITDQMFYALNDKIKNDTYYHTADFFVRSIEIDETCANRKLKEIFPCD